MITEQLYAKLSKRFRPSLQIDNAVHGLGIYGYAGSGKTTLAIALALALADKVRVSILTYNLHEVYYLLANTFKDIDQLLINRLTIVQINEPDTLDRLRDSAADYLIFDSDCAFIRSPGIAKEYVPFAKDRLIYTIQKNRLAVGEPLDSSMVRYPDFKTIVDELLAMHEVKQTCMK